MTATARTVRLFRNNRNQAIRIPKDLELPGEEAVLRKEGNKLIIEPASTATLLGLLKDMSSLNEDLPSVEDPLPEEVDL